MGANDSFFFSMTHLAEGITKTIFRREQPQDTIELKIPLSTADNKFNRDAWTGPSEDVFYFIEFRITIKIC